MIDYDLIVIGGGPAGLTAGLYAVRKGLSALVIERELEGGKVLEAYDIENYPGITGKIHGTRLIENIKEQVKSQNVIINTLESVTDVSKEENFIITTDKSKYNTKAVILATGTYLRKLGVKGEAKFRGKGVSYCATCDGPLFKNKTVAVVGGGNTAVSSALYLSEVVKKVYLIHRRNELRAENTLAQRIIKSDVEILWDSIPVEITGDKFVSQFVIENLKSKEIRSIDVDGVFIFVGDLPNNELANKLEIKLTEQGFVDIDKECRTSVKGVFAAGDITGVSLQIATAVGQGCTASLKAYDYIKGI